MTFHGTDLKRLSHPLEGKVSTLRSYITLSTSNFVTFANKAYLYVSTSELEHLVFRVCFSNNAFIYKIAGHILLNKSYQHILLYGTATAERNFGTAE